MDNADGWCISADSVANAKRASLFWCDVYTSASRIFGIDCQFRLANPRAIPSNWRHICFALDL
jgi:hypothetical protein